MNATTPYKSLPRLLAIIALVIAVPLWTACSGELNPAEPEDAYDIFRTALFEGDGETVWERTDDQTQEYFEDRYQRLSKMNDLIERFLPHTDHQIARTQSGAELLDEIDSGHGLFVRLFKPAEFPEVDAIRFGSEASALQMSEAGETAVVITRSEQEFTLVLQDDGLWYVNLVESGDFLDIALEWMTNNEEALEQTVEDLIADERQVREEIISELMNIDDE